MTSLPDREQETSRAWLSGHPSISIVARDRGGGYGEAIAEALPHADQVADRWHLMENASRAFLDAVRKSMCQIRKAVGSAVIDPKLLTYAGHLQYEGFLRRQETNEAILALSKQGVAVKRIVKRTGHSRKLVRSVYGVNARMSSGSGKALWRISCLGSMPDGNKASAMHQRFGARCARRGFVGKVASYRSTKAADACGYCFGQQDGTNDLGTDSKE